MYNLGLRVFKVVDKVTLVEYLPHMETANVTLPHSLFGHFTSLSTLFHIF
jgi:hypothetical protein